jgi:hypothetical protein
VDVGALAEQDQADQRKKERKDEAGHHVGPRIIASEAIHSFLFAVRWIASLRSQ